MRGSATKDTDSALAELREATRELTSDYDGLMATIEHARARAADFEAQAIEAVRRGDDAAAREALMRHEKQTTSLNNLLADAAVVRSMIEECERILVGRGRWS
jgi:phage shock protein A